MKKILGVIILWITVLYTLLFMCAVDGLMDSGLFWKALLIEAALIILVRVVYDKENIRKLMN